MAKRKQKNTLPRLSAFLQSTQREQRESKGSKLHMKYLLESAGLSSKFIKSSLVPDMRAEDVIVNDDYVNDYYESVIYPYWKDSRTTLDNFYALRQKRQNKAAFAEQAAKSTEVSKQLEFAVQAHSLSVLELTASLVFATNFEIGQDAALVSQQAIEAARKLCEKLDN